MTGGAIYVLDGLGTLHALGTGGTGKWKFTPPAAEASGFIVADGAVYATGDRTVYALHAADGGMAWSYATSNTIGARLAASGGTVFAANNDNVVYAIRSGTRVWSKQVGDGSNNLFGAQLAVSGAGVFVGAGDHNL